MRRLAFVPICLIAAFTFTAVVAGSASAAFPEYRTCLKASPKNTGQYSDKACATLESKGAGKYELGAWNASKKLTFKGNSGSTRFNAVDTLDTTTGPGEVLSTTTCAKSKTEGELAGPKTSTWKTKYTKCEAAGVKCNTPGQKAGIIVTEQLTGTLVNLNTEEGPGRRVGVRIVGAGLESVIAPYECPPATARVELKGELLAELTGDINRTSKTSGLVAKAGPLGLQSDLYEEEAFSEVVAKGRLGTTVINNEHGITMEECMEIYEGDGYSTIVAEHLCKAQRACVETLLGQGFLIADAEIICADHVPPTEEEECIFVKEHQGFTQRVAEAICATLSEPETTFVEIENKFTTSVSPGTVETDITLTSTPIGVRAN